MTTQTLILLGFLCLWFPVSLGSRFWGAVLGMLLSGAVGCLGAWLLFHGQRMYILGMPRPLTLGAFCSLVSLLILTNAVTAAQAWRGRGGVPQP